MTTTEDVLALPVHVAMRARIQDANRAMLAAERAHAHAERMADLHPGHRTRAQDFTYAEATSIHAQQTYRDLLHTYEHSITAHCRTLGAPFRSSVGLTLDELADFRAAQEERAVFDRIRAYILWREKRQANNVPRSARTAITVQDILDNLVQEWLVRPVTADDVRTVFAAMGVAA